MIQPVSWILWVFNGLLLRREPLSSADRKTVVPVHSGEVIGPGLLTSILRQIQITRDELFEQP